MTGAAASGLQVRVVATSSFIHKTDRKHLLWGGANIQSAVQQMQEGLSSRAALGLMGIDVQQDFSQQPHGGRLLPRVFLLIELAKMLINISPPLFQNLKKKGGGCVCVVPGTEVHCQTGCRASFIVSPGEEVFFRWLSISRPGGVWGKKTKKSESEMFCLF